MSSASHLKTVNKFTVTDLILIYVVSMGIALWLAMTSYFFREKSCHDQQVKPRVFITVFLLGFFGYIGKPTNKLRFQQTSIIVHS